MVAITEADWHNTSICSKIQNIKLYFILTNAQRRRRIWLIDRQVASIGLELRDDLGDWIRRRLTKGVEGQGLQAKKILDACGVSSEELRSQWDLQRASQLSLRARK